MATTASTMHSRGLKNRFKSTIIPAKSAGSGKRKWYSGFTVPGTAPNIFFAAADRDIMPWLFSLQKFMMASAPSRYEVYRKDLATNASGKSAVLCPKSRFSVPPNFSTAPTPVAA